MLLGRIMEHTPKDGAQSMSVGGVEKMNQESHCSREITRLTLFPARYPVVIRKLRPKIKSDSKK
jgi:hypothetical protein